MTITSDTRSSTGASLHEHVLTSLSEARSTVECEQDELEAERRAFVQFKDRITGIESVPPSRSSPAPTTRTYPTKSRPRSDEGARAAFCETVMSVNHYEEVYDESLEEHAAAELSPEVAAGLRCETVTPFTEWYKSTLTSAVDAATAQREAFCDQLNIELQSLDESRTAFTELFDACDGPSVPTRYRSEFRSRLDDIAWTRQKVIQRRPHSVLTDGHDLCEYLYHSHDWTYPVLIAVARFRTSTV